jgi:hypothetical protein
MLSEWPHAHTVRVPDLGDVEMRAGRPPDTTLRPPFDEMAPPQDWRGQWDEIGSRERRLAYLEEYWPDLLTAIRAGAEPEPVPPAKRSAKRGCLLALVAVLVTWAVWR